MKCVDITELVTDYVEGRMGLRDRLSFQLHLGRCAHCRAYLRQMKRTVRALASLPAQPAQHMPENVRAELTRRFRDWKPGNTGGESGEH